MIHDMNKNDLRLLEFIENDRELNSEYYNLLLQKKLHEQKELYEQKIHQNEKKEDDEVDWEEEYNILYETMWKEIDEVYERNSALIQEIHWIQKDFSEKSKAQGIAFMEARKKYLKSRASVPKNNMMSTQNLAAEAEKEEQSD